MPDHPELTRARIAASDAADLAFNVAQAAYSAGQMEAYRKHLADFRRAKDAEKEARAREIAGVLHPLVDDAADRLLGAVAALEAEIKRQVEDAQKANEVAAALNIMLSIVLLFAL